MVRLLPKEVRFVEMFEELGAAMERGAMLLRDTLRDGQNAEVQVEALKSIEHEGDQLTHSLMTRLNQTFITPFDREDIHRLASSMDDVLDFVNAAGVRLKLYKIKDPPPAAADLAALIVQQSEELARGVSLLEKNGLVLEHCVEVNRLENEADRVSRKAIADLFEHERDPIQLIKIKELYEVLESATDKAEDAANVLEAVTLKSA